MRKNKGQLGISAGVPLPQIKHMDTSGDTGKSYHRVYLAAVRREWLLLFGRLREGASDLTFTEIRNIEARVRKELYP